MTQVHHRTSSTHTTIYYGTKAVARCCQIGGDWQVALSTSNGAKHFARHSLASAKEAVKYYLEEAA